MRSSFIYAIVVFVVTTLVVAFAAVAIFYMSKLKSTAVLTTGQINTVFYTQIVLLILALLIWIWSIFVFVGSRRYEGYDSDDEDDLDYDVRVRKVATAGPEANVERETTVITAPAGANINNIAADYNLQPGTLIQVNQPPTTCGRATAAAVPNAVVNAEGNVKPLPPAVVPQQVPVQYVQVQGQPQPQYVQVQGQPQRQYVQVSQPAQPQPITVPAPTQVTVQSQPLPQQYVQVAAPNQPQYVQVAGPGQPQYVTVPTQPQVVREVAPTYQVAPAYSGTGIPQAGVAPPINVSGY